MLPPEFESPEVVHVKSSRSSPPLEYELNSASALHAESGLIAKKKKVIEELIIFMIVFGSMLYLMLLTR